MNMKFNSSTEIVTSDTLFEPLLEWVHLNGNKQITVLLDASVQNNPLILSLRTELESRQLLANWLTLEVKEPTTEDVYAITEQVERKTSDLLVGIGGGSLLDLCKAVSAALHIGKDVSEAHSQGVAIRKATDKILIPTTAGTGSEVTPGAVLVNPKTEFKRALAGPAVSAKQAILCAELTLSMPRHVMASTGFDALAHAIESYTAKCANTVSRMYSRQAFQLIANSLPQLLNDPSDIEKRRDLLLGSCLAGYAIYNSNTGAAHSMAYPLGIYKGVHHGVAITWLLPEVVQHNVDNGCKLYQELEPLMNDGYSGIPMPEFLYKLRDHCDLPKRLSGYGIESTDVPFLAERGLDLKSALNNNPVEFPFEVAKSVLNKVL